jgi:hypothetical protein
MVKTKSPKDKLLETAVTLLAATVINGKTVKRGSQKGSELVLFTPRMCRARKKLIRDVIRILPTGGWRRF